MDKLSVYKNNKKVGHLYKQNDLFVYENDNDMKLSYNLPAILNNLLPEGINREEFVIKNNIKNDDFEILKYLNDCLGGFSTSKTKKKIIYFEYNYSFKNSFIYIDDIQIEKPLKDKMQEKFNEVNTSIKVSNVSGQQPKTTAIFEQKGLFNFLRYPQENEYSNSIVKFHNEKYLYINLVEHLYLQAIKNIGFDTADSLLVIDKEEYKSEFLREIKTTLIIKRFDRLKTKPKESYELLSLMGYVSDKKYEVSIEEIFTFLSKLKKEKQFCQKEINKIAIYYYLSYILQNGDAHPKNIVLFKNRKKYKVAPFYDIVNTKIYGIKDSLGISLYKDRKVEIFSEDELLKVLQKFVNIEIFAGLKIQVIKEIENLIIHIPYLDDRFENLKEALLISLKNANDNVNG